MKDFDIKIRSKYYEFDNNVSYKRKNVDFNEYGFNRYENSDDILLNYKTKTGPICVKKIIKR